MTKSAPLLPVVAVALGDGAGRAVLCILAGAHVGEDRLEALIGRARRCLAFEHHPSVVADQLEGGVELVDLLLGIAGDLDQFVGDVFFDDDVIIPESYLVDLCDLISQHPDLQVLGGPNLSPPQATLFERASGLALASTWGTSAISSRYSLRKDSFFTRSELPFALCNLCIKNENQDLFHKDLKYGEETDLLQRLFKDSKCLGLYSPQLFVWHFRRPTWSSFMIQMFKYGLGRGLTLKEASSNRKLQFLGLVGLYLFLAIILLLHPVLLLSVLILISILSLMTAPKPFDIKLWFYLSLSLIFIYALYPLGVIVGAIRRFFPSIEEHP